MAMVGGREGIEEGVRGGDRQGPLCDVVIVDCTMALAGPFAGGLLADLGADVIKVEPPTGDLSRGIPPHPKDFATPSSAREAGCDYGGYFASINRGKRSVVLDLKDADDRERLFQLCEQADGLIENTRAGVMDRLGCGYEAIARRNPRIVYGAIRGFGDPRTGESPYVDWPAFDIVAQCMGGLAHINGPEGGHGFPAGASMGDLYPGTLLALGMVSAIHHARNSGEGQFLDIAMYDSIAYLCETLIANYSFENRVLGPRGSGHPNLCPFDIFPTRDGGVAIAAPGPKHWEALCETMDRPDLMTDERSRDLKARVANRDYVTGELETWTLAHTKAEVTAALGGRVPCGPVNTAADLYADPHMAARDMIQPIDLPGDNVPAAVMANPIKFTRTPARRVSSAPTLDEHRTQVFEEYALKDNEPAGD